MSASHPQIIFTICLSLLSLACLGGCEEPPRRTDPAPGRSPDRAVRVFKIARIPYRTARTVFEQAESLCSELARPIGYDRVEIETARDYMGIARMLESGAVQAAWLGTAAYASLRLGSGQGPRPIPLVAPVREGHSYYEGVVISRVSSGIKTLEALKRRKVAFVDPESASGYVFPRLMLEAAGVRVPQDLATVVPNEPDFLHRHDSVVLAVYFKKFDAGAVYDESVHDVFLKEPEKVKELQVIARTRRIFNEPIVMLSNTDPKLRARVQSALVALTIPPAVRELSGQLEKFTAVTEQDYEPVEEMIRGHR
jgi:phosphate/phosphite/phosphonate ABC transporter binding protein